MIFPSLRTLLLALAFGLGAIAWSRASSQHTSEPAVRAGFVYNFAKFTEWPANRLQGPSVRLCLPGGDPLGAATQLIGGRLLQGRTVEVRRNVRSEELGDCDIVYVTDVDERRQLEVLRLVRGLPILSIGEGEAFTETGGVIGLVAVGGRLQFEISLEAAHRAELRIDAQLLKLARNVKGRGTP